MPSTTSVVISELEGAANKILEACEQYQAAAAALKDAADTLASTWEGDSQIAFVNEQEQASAWYKKMADTVNQYAAEMKAAAAKYVATDLNAAQVIRSN